MPTWPKWNVEHECRDLAVRLGAPRVEGVVAIGGGKVSWVMSVGGDSGALLEPILFCPTCGEKLPRVVKITVYEAT